MHEAILMTRLTKAQARKRLEEAKSKVILCAGSGHITLEAAAKVCSSLDQLLRRMK